MRAPDLPLVTPQRLARPLTPAEVLALVGGRRVPGVDLDDPLVREMRRNALSGVAWQDFHEARQRGYLRLVVEPHTAEMAPRLVAVWGWWCAAAKRPAIVARASGPALDATVRVDLSPAGRVFSPHALAPVARALAEYAGTAVGSWRFTRDGFDVDGLPMDAAWGLAAALVTITLDRRFVVSAVSPSVGQAEQSS